MHARNKAQALDSSARWVVGLLAAAAVVEASVMAMSLAFLYEDSFDPDYFALAGKFEFPVFLACSVAWLIWQYGAHKRLARLAKASLHFTPKSAVGWWFVPFAQLVQPFRAMTELAGAPLGNAGVSGVGAPAAQLLTAWWACFLGGNAISRLAALVMASGDESDALIWALIASVALSIAGVLAILVVRSVESRLGPAGSDSSGLDPAGLLNAVGGAAVGAVAGAGVWVLGYVAVLEIAGLGSLGELASGLILSVLAGAASAFLVTTIGGHRGPGVAVLAVAGAVAAVLIGNGTFKDLSTSVGGMIDDAHLPLLSGGVVFGIAAAAAAGAVAIIGLPLQPREARQVSSAESPR